MVYLGGAIVQYVFASLPLLEYSVFAGRGTLVGN